MSSPSAQSQAEPLYAPTNQRPSDIVSFWSSAQPKWFASTPTFDEEIRSKFGEVHEAAARGAPELDAWEQSPTGALAKLLLLDQFPRNMFRGTARAFATDKVARDVADRAVTKGFHKAPEVQDHMRGFFILPFTHSENAEDQDKAVALYEASGKPNQWAVHHQGIVKQFGRFPHRNELLGRKSTPEELAFLEKNSFRG